MATSFARNRKGISKDLGLAARQNESGLRTRTINSIDKLKIWRSDSSERQLNQNNTLVAPKALIPKDKQLQYRKVPYSIRKSEGLTIFKGPYDVGEAAEKNRNTPMRRRKSTDYIIIHETANEGLQGNLNIISKNRLAHFLVGRDGKIYQMVPNLASRTNHLSKRVLWKECKGIDMKNRSIGIEFLGNPYESKPTDSQYAAGRKIIRSLMKMYGIPSNRVLSHGMVSCDNPDEKCLTRGAYRDIDGAYYVSAEGRRKLNIGPGPSSDPNGARPGPHVQRIVYDSNKTRIVELKDSETLWRFSKRTGIPLETIFELNKGIDPRKISPNEKITIPVSV